MGNISPKGSDSLNLVGALLDGRYRIDAPIARGGMSVVYQGMDVRLDRPVAVKVMDPRFSEDPQFLERFEFEARSIARLNHPALVAVHDQGTDGQHVFLVMELVPGGTLRELLRERGPMPPYAAAAVARPVLRALAVAHRAGLVHRDIKPENVLISDSGAVKIADFGLVRAVAASGTTSGSMILGTAAYLSPEQVSIGSADARSDVYSMGILLFEMLTGRTPFTGDSSIAIAYQRTSNDVPAPSSIIAGVPAELDAFVVKATQREPEKRFADASEMVHALVALTDKLALPQYRVPAPKRSAQHETMSTMHGVAGGDKHGGANLDSTETANAGSHTTVIADESGVAPPENATGRSPSEKTTALSPPVSAPPVAVPPVPVPPVPGPPVPVPQAGSPTSVLPVGAPQTTSTPPTGDAAVGQPHPSENDLSPSRGPRSPLVLLIIVLLLAATIGMAGWWFGSGRYVNVPEITGLDLTSAESAIEEAGLRPVRDGQYQDAIPADTILDITPSPGSRIVRRSDVVLAVSLGQPTVPEIDGDITVEDMIDELRDRTFVPVLGDGVFHQTRPEGSVVSLSPASGTTLNVGSTVTVTPSRGEPIIVPNVRGMSVDDARAVLADAGLNVGTITEEFDGGIDDGDVAETQPAIGSEAAQGETVTIVVSNAIRVPSVLGRNVGSARTELSDLGFNVDVRQLVSSDSSIVIGQNPSAGSRQRPGGTITLTALP
ncbi:PASTA domain-containing protein [Hoyosella rhizosphaerae]|uniref:non-specific serine/threonine protein kinase n=1 Tax=Hoyosella rhizosphaerae TaxID=1755582 RepID=A0A916UEW2_9ACTN|nr:Stk1 family PASTA domain-containing Ser/Thr kinase [Hoyosella rhizosphaerae]MBN4927936.1 PASTA domain-containing protein [Hoyosella rhizosphaerae]GGC71126.1 hypothetical protein GCM10011410_25040 [Hoyosella rhizosphaerae]